MAFDDFKKSLGEFTSDVTDKVTDTVKNPIKTMKDATDGVGKKVLGPRLDVVEQAHDELRIDQLKKVYKKAVRSWSTAVKKHRVNAKKVTAMVKSLNSYTFVGDDFDDVYDNVKSFLKTVKAEIKKGQYVGELENGEIKSLKKYSLTKTEHPFFEETFKEMVERYEHDAVEVKKDLTTAMTVELKKSVDMNAVYKEKSKELDVTHNDSMDASIELLSAWRKFFAVLRTSEKNMKAIKKMETEKRSASAVAKKKLTTQIESKLKATKTLLDKEGKKAVAAITSAEKDIEKGYTDITELLTSYTTSYTDGKKTLKDWIAANIKQTAAVKKSTTTLEKRADTSVKTLIKKEKTVMHAIDTALKKPFTATDKVTKAMSTFDTNYNAQQEGYLKQAVCTATTALHEAKDHGLKSVPLDMFHNYIYNDMFLLRKNTVFLGFANRYHKNHAKYAKDAWNKLIDLKRSHSTLFKDLVPVMQKKAEYYTGLIKVNDKTINTQKSQVSDFRSMQWDVLKIQKLYKHQAELLVAQESLAIHKEHHASLKAEMKRLAQHNKMMKSYGNQIEGAIQKTNTELKDKEKSLSVKSTVALKKEVENLHKQKHEQEAVHNAYNHYIEELQDHLKELKDLLNGYAKIGKAENKKVSSLQKTVKTSKKKVAKTKTMKEVNV